MQLTGRLSLLPVSPGRLRRVLVCGLLTAFTLLLSVMGAATTEYEPGMFGDSFDFPW